MKRSISGILALSLVLASAALAQAFTWPASWTRAKPGEAKRGGTYIEATISDFRTMNPFLTAEAGSIPDRMTLNGIGLVTRDPTTGKWIPYMATSWKVSQDQTEITFKIRRGMKWSDGQPITADDWIMTYRIHMDPKVGSNLRDSFFIGDKVVKVEKIDDYTLRFVYPKPDAEAFAIASFSPWPAHVFGPVYEKQGADGIKKMWGLNEDPGKIVTWGPFVVAAYRPGERVIFKRNPYFGEWNKDAAGNPLPYLDAYQVNIVKDTNAELAAFLTGEIDQMNPATVEQIAQIKKAINAGKLDATLKVNASPIASSQFVVFNWNKKSDPFKEKLFRSAKFRKAMSHLINRQAVVEVVYGGLGTPMYGSVYPVLTQWINNDAPKYPYDPEAAKKLLAELGFTKKDAEGYLVDAQGRRLEFNLATNAGNKQREQIAKLFVDEAKKVGVKINFRPIDFNTLVGQLLSKGPDRPFDAIIIGLTGGGLDWPFGSNVVPCRGNLHMWNRAGTCLDPRETLMEYYYYKGRTTLDFEKRVQIGYKLQEVEGELLPIVYIAGPNYHTAWNNRIGGWHPDKIISSIWGSGELPLLFRAK